MKDLVEHIAKSLVDNPEDVNVTVVEGERTQILELRVRQSDMGQVIGKSGRTAKAMRTLLDAAATRDGKRVVLEIVE
ncbi:KH domain-containing protein [Candidatus Hydrogenedentota bacterium]